MKVKPAVSTRRRRSAAFATAAGYRARKSANGGRGAMADVPASPISPGGYELWMVWTSIAGASSMRSDLLDTSVLGAWYLADGALHGEAKDDRTSDLRLNVG